MSPRSRRLTGGFGGAVRPTEKEARRADAGAGEEPYGI